MLLLMMNFSETLALECEVLLMAYRSIRLPFLNFFRKFIAHHSVRNIKRAFR